MKIFTHFISSLGELLRRDGELLPVDSPEPLWLYNTNVVVDALDECASSIVRFDSGVIMDVETYVRPEAIAGHVAFKLSALRASPTFLCSPFVELWKKHKLNGLTFKEIYRLTFQ